MELDDLENLGLSHNEAIIYLTLLELGETTTGPIVKKTGFHRVIVYDSLEKLIKKGLASFIIKNNIRYFQSTDPNRLIDFIKEKEEIAKSILPELENKRNLSKYKQEVSVYEGRTGIKSALQNMLKELSPKGSYKCFASGDMAEFIGPYYNIYQKIKRKNRIKSLIIYDISFKKNKNVLKNTIGVKKFYTISYFPTDTFIYNDKVLIIIWNARPPIAILITNEDAAESYNKMFNVFWREAKFK